MKLKQKIQTKGINFKTNMRNNDQIKISVNADSECRELTKLINNIQVEQHTYEKKQTRSLKVMARNLQPSRSPEEIRVELKIKCYENFGCSP